VHNTRNLLLALVAAPVLLLAACRNLGPEVVNTTTSSEGYREFPEIRYREPGQLALDIYAPDQIQGAPTVVFFYGGRWSSGNKNLYRFVGQALASRGIVTVIPNYRLYPAVRFPAFVEDGAAAVRWTQQNIQQYGGSANRLFVMGHSAGAQIASLLALNPDYLQAAGSTRSILKGMIGLAGPYDFMPITDPELRDIFAPPEKFPLSQPIRFVDGRNPPLLLLHGEDDQDVWISNTRNLAKAVAEAGGVAETVTYPKMNHSMIMAALGSLMRGQSDVLDHVEAFIKRNADAMPATAPLTHHLSQPLTDVPSGDDVIQPEPLPVELPPSSVSDGVSIIAPEAVAPPTLPSVSTGDIPIILDENNAPAEPAP
jgi:acetyl esterase/lipase